MIFAPLLRMAENHLSNLVDVQQMVSKVWQGRLPSSNCCQYQLFVQGEYRGGWNLEVATNLERNHGKGFDSTAANSREEDGSHSLRVWIFQGYQIWSSPNVGRTLKHLIIRQTLQGKALDLNVNSLPTRGETPKAPFKICCRDTRCCRAATYTAKQDQKHKGRQCALRYERWPRLGLEGWS